MFLSVNVTADYVTGFTDVGKTPPTAGRVSDSDDNQTRAAAPVVHEV